MAQPPPSRRQTPFLVGLVLILAALPLGWFVFLRQPPPAPPPPPPPPVVTAPAAKKPLELEITEVSGTVEVLGADGTWQLAKVGTALRQNEKVRTEDGSYAMLIGGEAVEVRMDPGTEISVEALTESVSRILLGSGMATAIVRPGQRHTFEVKAANADAVATLEQAGAFTMSNNGKGTVAVGTREGEVTLLGQGKVVIVRAGQQAVIRPGQAPSEPAPVPSSLLLKVDWPADRTRRERELVVRGQTDPGSRVEVGGVTVTPDAQGHFERKVVLREGHNTVDVRAVGVGRIEQRDKQDVVVDTTPPPLKTDTQDIWNQANNDSR
ncbi:FecR domain-containing protein [Pyxidicoccus parkwayensis]|uniref:FecR domain-containing protein n=1 Tax=Pyxidicoccus parkwayensis TaxID=2813578 RepID=A0ABX7P476_9BACT|nr:FecR domain-containing protein [Pyxidicoccus parkwaysis]QSQ25230.1 FecR domain-containing protein [Pyxidicoccus parkwaysis]